MAKEATANSAPEKPLMNVYQAIAFVTENLSKQGISKDRKNEQQGYKFRGIDDVYNALAPFLAEARLCVLPTVLSREVVERTTSKGGVLFYVTVQVRFDFVSADDGSKHEVVTYGEAMDSGDKATNKAMSAAYKYACMQAFCIPTEGDNDPDASTPDVTKKPKGEFESQEKRDQFVAECVKAIEGVATFPDLKDQKTCHLAKWNAMRTSEVGADVTAFDKITAAYNAKFAEFKAQAEAKKGAAAKPKTVEAAKAAQSPVLGDDEIPF